MQAFTLSNFHVEKFPEKSVFESLFTNIMQPL